MRNFYLLFLLYSCSLFSQVGIGTTTPNGVLDVVSSNQGLLIPRVELTSTNVSAPVINPTSGVLANSTLIYNSATNGIFPNNVFPGFYYWDGLKWVRLNTESSWLVNGNENTNSSINFLGTLDNTDLVFKRNNVFSGKISSSNTAFGVNAFSNTSSAGLRSVAIGVNALKTNTSGNDNVALGHGALESNTTGIQNTAIGTSSLSLNTSGGYNVAIGYESLTRNTTGILNVAIGGSSLYNNSSGRFNVAIGKSAMERNISGISNTSVGYNTLYNNQTGSDNVSIGKSSLERNVNGSYNIGIGSSSLFNNQASSYSIAIGSDSQTNNLSGSRNVSLGHQSLYTNSGGSNNIAIGYRAFYLGDYINSIALGSNTIITADNQVRIGNNTTASIGGFTSWTNVSDERFKSNVNYKSVPGLDFILKLKPVTYHLDNDKINAFIGYKISNKSYTRLQTGFIAQEVAESASNIGFDFSGVDKPKNKDDYYGLRYAEFVVPLTKAIQEQQIIIQEQQKELELLKHELKKTQATIERLSLLKE